MHTFDEVLHIFGKLMFYESILIEIYVLCSPLYLKLLNFKMRFFRNQLTLKKASLHYDFLLTVGSKKILHFS